VQQPGKPGAAAQRVENGIHLDVNQSGGPAAASRLPPVE